MNAQRQTYDLMREAMPDYDPAEANSRLEDMLSDWKRPLILAPPCTAMIDRSMGDHLR